MYRPFLLAMLFVAPVLAQEEARLRELIQNLDDDSFEVREKAQKDLVALGEPAVPYLRAAVTEAENQKEKAEIKSRALAALHAIEFAAKAKQFYAEPKLVTIHCADAELGGILADLEKQTGVRMDPSAIDAKSKVSLDAREAPLFRVLDDLCRGQEERSYEYRDSGVQFQRSRFVPCPTAYEGPFRIRMVKLKHERSTDWKTSEAQAQFTLEADWQKYLKPSKKVDLEIRKATDGQGTELEAVKAGTGDEGVEGIVAMGGGRFIMRRAGVIVGQVTAEEQTAQLFTLKGLRPGATRLTVQGVARFHFPLEKTDVVFSKPASGEAQQAGDVTISLKSMGGGRVWKIALSHTPGRPAVNPEDLDGRIDRESVVALDDAGKEHKGTVNESRPMEMQFVVRGGIEVPDGTPLLSFQALFPTLENRIPKEIHFKFVSQVFVKSVPFTLSDIALP
jgi:hypothetical protein